MSWLLIEAERIKLARLLGVPVAELDYLSRASVAELRAVREAVARSMVEEDRALFGRLVAATRLLPAAVVATIAERVMGPMICARVAGLMDPDQVIEVARRLSTPFLAEVCLHLDPRSAAATLGRMPLPVIVAVAAELLRRGEYLTMARFVEFITDEAIAAVAKTMPDVAVLRVGFFVESRERLNELVGLFDDRRIRSIIATTAADPEQLWPQALTLMEQVGNESRGRLARLGLAGQETILVSLLQTANRTGLHEPLLTVLRGLDSTLVQRLGEYPLLADLDLIGPLFESALRSESLGYLLPLAGALPESTRLALSEVLQRQPASRVQAVARQLGQPLFAERLRRDWSRLRPLLPRNWLPSLKDAGFD